MAQSRVYEDFQPPYDWERDERSDTLILSLEGFSRNQLKVQVTSSRTIRVSGERPVEGNRWRRFYREFPLPLDADTNEIGARFERGTLYVKFPKLITPVKTQPPPTQGAPPPPPPPPPPKPATREERKVEQAVEKKPETKDQPTMEQREKEPPEEKEKDRPREKKDISEGKALMEEEPKAEAKAPETQEYYKQEESRSLAFSERISSMQAQDYKEAIAGLVAELMKQKKVINKLVVVFVVLLLGLYLKHLIKSSFGGSKTQEL